MEIGQQSLEVEGATVDEPPLGGSTHLHEKHHIRNPGQPTTPLNPDRSQVADLAHALDVERTVALLASSLQ